eukprot:1138766-Pelagomonas_calceolata.AAC.4
MQCQLSGRYLDCRQQFYVALLASLLPPKLVLNNQLRHVSKGLNTLILQAFTVMQAKSAH